VELQIVRRTAGYEGIIGGGSTRVKPISYRIHGIARADAPARHSDDAYIAGIGAVIWDISVAELCYRVVAALQQNRACSTRFDDDCG
ncbi:MAG: hypothetical protein J0L88_04635, partial [Xanthomonadales bacterium]|nr:hypothetical protein [Xanthomonadales bacterium]